MGIERCQGTRVCSDVGVDSVGGVPGSWVWKIPQGGVERAGGMEVAHEDRGEPGESNSVAM